MGRIRRTGCPYSDSRTPHGFADECWMGTGTRPCKKGRKPAAAMTLYSGTRVSGGPFPSHASWAMGPDLWLTPSTRITYTILHSIQSIPAAPRAHGTTYYHTIPTYYPIYEEEGQATESDHDIIEWKWSKTAPGLKVDSG